MLVPHGIAVGRFDRRGDNVPLDHQADDALFFVQELKERPDVDPRRIGLWGFSQGAWVAPLVATRSRDVAFLVLVASTGVTPAAQMRYGTAKHARMAGYGEDVAERIDEARRRMEEWRRGRLPIADAQRSIDEIVREPWFEHAWLPERLDPESRWPDMDFDPEPIFAGVRVPVLLFYGEDDEWQPIDDSVAAWHRAAKRAGNGDVTVVRLAGTGHTPTLGGREDPQAVSPEYEQALIEWITAVTGR